MGQIFDACIYDIDSMSCCVMDADKFHANCYSFSGTVAVTHYLLRQRPYRVMWCGQYASLGSGIAEFSRTEDLLGISTCTDYEDIKNNNEDLEEEDWFDKAKFIGENHGRWKHMKVWDEAEEYFEFEDTRSVKYNGYLLNHTKKLAVELGDYFVRSMFRWRKRRIAAIDMIPVLTETGGGTSMALFDGVAADSTEQLAGTWCGDLLQIVDQLPGDYERIDCCFSEIWNRADFCYRLFGVDASNYVLGDRHGRRYECAARNLWEKRGLPRHVKVEFTEDKIQYIAELISKPSDTPAIESEKDREATR